jgi:hypothetical protein
MTTLTPELRQAIEQSGDQPPVLIDPETQTAYVLIRADQYERLKALFGQDEVEGMSPLLADLSPEDWEDPSHYERGKRQTGDHSHQTEAVSGTDSMGDGSSKVVNLLEQIVLGSHLGEETARQLESTILEQFPDADDDERFEQLLHILASYRPGGGEFMYDTSALAEEARRALSLLKS